MEVHGISEPILYCAQNLGNLRPAFLFLIFYAINASFAVVFSLNELKDSHFVLMSCYLRELFKNSVQSSENQKPIYVYLLTESEKTDQRSVEYL